MQIHGRNYFDWIPRDSLAEQLQKFDFENLKELCDKYIDLVDGEIRIANNYELETKLDKKRKRVKYELYQINKYLKGIELSK